ncbi:MAG TPA: M56 family metallopeptidase [Candidatus Eisenbergiella merdavium]|uniref:M56 family metallopeptidase n=1 Tax=Candidatus Eisenbergiella merdavium TaxID=2838551 RepID=A0A9D2SPX4_9FIRM|nr:M56 family metallopeptidase [Candidatus Eisenbergiella merdavium]
MRALFLNMLSVSVFTAVFIGVFSLICRIISRKEIPALTCAMGLFIALRMLFFLTVPLPFSVSIPMGLAVNGSGLENAAESESAPESGVERLANGDGREYQRALSSPESSREGLPGFVIVLLDGAAWLWTGGCAALLLFHGISYAGLRCRIRRKGTNLNAEENRIYERCAEELRYGINIRVRRLAGISSPFGIGYFFQMIIIPEGLTDAGILEHVFRHEIIHARRFDNWYKLALLAAQCVHWFNPVTARYFRKAERAQECLCDRQATEGKSLEERKAYCGSILAVMENGRRSSLWGIRNPFADRRSEGKEDVRQRLLEILRADSRLRVKKAAAIPLLLFLLALTALFHFSAPGKSLLQRFLEGKTYYADETDAYGRFEGFRGHSTLEIFPEEIPPGGKAEAYFYFYQDTFLDPSAQIYLECSYEDAAYAEEVSRLSGIRSEYEGRTQAVRFDEENFNHPAYVTVYADDHCYEYALILGENRIAYLFLQFQDRDEVRFPADYLPLDYGEEDGETGFSIYLFDRWDGSRAGNF